MRTDNATEIIFERKRPSNNKLSPKKIPPPPLKKNYFKYPGLLFREFLQWYLLIANVILRIDACQNVWHRSRAVALIV